MKPTVRQALFWRGGDQEESAFTKVHDNQIIKSEKRLYMTATPRLYNDASKQKAAKSDYILCSMDDKSLYGEEIYRIGFGEAVQNNLLSDYKVLVLTMTEDQVPKELQKAISNPDYEINTDDATKLIGCINALSKRMVKYIGSNEEAELLKKTDPNPMHTAVAFCPKIKDSEKIAKILNVHSENYYESLSRVEREEVVNVKAKHIDGSMGAMKRNEKLSWLKHAPKEGKECRILTNVHILDPFTGTGTFITRLLQSGRIKEADLKRKYEEELHANEIVLLAYYIASVNIENTYHDLIEAKGEYQNFEGICLTDTFQLNEDEGKIPYSEYFLKNVKRVQKQKETPITVIIGNPPYSVGQKSANDNAQNQKYENLDRRIAETYAKESKATNKNSLYDSYIKAFRWASDRLDKTGGIIGFVSNGGWIDGNAMDGFRYLLEREFSTVYVFNLRGGIRGKSGDEAKKEGPNVFNIMTGVAITILVKNPNRITEKATIYYHDIGDYLSREEKLKIISDFGSVINLKFKMEILQPNEHNDWLNQRNEVFGSFIAIGDKNNKNNNSTFFVPYYSNGLKTQRDAWCYNFSKQHLENNIERMLAFYNEQLNHITDNNIEKSKVREFLSNDKTKISWSDNLVSYIQRHLKLQYSSDNIVESVYRPYCKYNLYYSKALNERVYQIPKLFPNNNVYNLVICVSGLGSNNHSVPIITNLIPDLGLNSACQCFPLYWYEEKTQNAPSQGGLFSTENSENDDKYIRHDGVTDFIHNLAKEKYGHKVTKEDIFYYVYGILHSEDYRTKFAADLKKMLPRIPLVDKVDDFGHFQMPEEI